MKVAPRDRRSATPLSERLAALGKVVELGDDRVDAEALDGARDILARAGQRLRLSGDHTVVALAGATGSGKSSMFNTLVGLELSEVGVRRPTTSETLACMWGSKGAGPLLDWLEVPRRNQVTRDSDLDSEVDSELYGLVLLDLPDHDSANLSHRLQVDRLVEIVDVLVWVLDPQKYADYAIHERYLRRLAGHDNITVVLLNQVDRLEAGDVAACRADLGRLLREDGLAKAPVLATSTVTEAGLVALRALLVRRVMQHRGVAARLSADIDRVAERLLAGCDGPPAPVLVSGDVHAVETAIFPVAEVPVAVDAVVKDYVDRAARVTGWPVIELLRGPRLRSLLRSFLSFLLSSLRSLLLSFLRSCISLLRFLGRSFLGSRIGTRLKSRLSSPFTTRLGFLLSSRLGPYLNLLRRGRRESEVAEDSAVREAAWWSGAGTPQTAAGTASQTAAGTAPQTAAEAPQRTAEAPQRTARATGTLQLPLQPPTPTQRSQVETALREFADSVAAPLPRLWADSVRHASLARASELPDALHRALIDSGVRLRTPAWWRIARSAQEVLSALTLAGILWLFALTVVALIRVPGVPPPTAGWFVVSSSLFVAGLLSGLLVAWAGRFATRAGLAPRRAFAEERLRAVARSVVRRLVLNPVTDELTAFREVRAALDRVR